MSSKEHTSNKNEGASKQQSPQQNAQGIGTFTQQASLSALIQRFQLKPNSMSQRDMSKLQSVIGNQAIIRLLARTPLLSSDGDDYETAKTPSSDDPSFLDNVGSPIHAATRQPMEGLKLQRKIIVGGTPYEPNPLFLAQIEADYGERMKEFVERMHNGGGSPTYTFSSFAQLKTEISIRSNAIKGMELVHAGCCDYPHGEGFNLNSTYWEERGTGTFVPKSPLPAGKKASDAIEAIFAPDAETLLECFRMATAIQYYSLLKSLGEDKFNAMFPGGAGLEISTRMGQIPALFGEESKKKYKIIRVSNKSEILPGDWVYFKNFPDYLDKHPGGPWQGENAIYLGGNKYRGFGVDEKTEDQMNEKLVNVYNEDLTMTEKKSKSDLLAIGRGLRLSPVIRPIMSKIAP